MYAHVAQQAGEETMNGGAANVLAYCIATLPQERCVNAGTLIVGVLFLVLIVAAVVFLVRSPGGIPKE